MLLRLFRTNKLGSRKAGLSVFKHVPAMSRPLSSWTWITSQTFPSDMGTARRLIGEVMSVVRADPWTERELFADELILEEAFANAVQHGNKADPEKKIKFECKVNADKIWVRIEDEGPGFDPGGLADPTDPVNQMLPSGRGVLLIKHFVTRVQWHAKGNVIEFQNERYG